MATGATTIHGDLNTKHNYNYSNYAGMVQNISSTEVTSWQETASGAMKPIVPIAQKK